MYVHVLKYDAYNEQGKILNHGWICCLSHIRRKEKLSPAVHFGQFLKCEYILHQILKEDCLIGYIPNIIILCPTFVYQSQ